MSFAWEVTEDDIAVLLGLHEVPLDARTVFEEHCGNAASERVEKAVLRYVKFDDQSDAAMSVLEDILMEAGIVWGEKFFSLP